MILHLDSMKPLEDSTYQKHLGRMLWGRWLWRGSVRYAHSVSVCRREGRWMFKVVSKETSSNAISTRELRWSLSVIQCWKETASAPLHGPGFGEESHHRRGKMTFPRQFSSAKANPCLCFKKLLWLPVVVIILWPPCYHVFVSKSHSDYLTTLPLFPMVVMTTILCSACAQNPPFGDSLSLNYKNLVSPMCNVDLFETSLRKRQPVYVKKKGLLQLT